METHDFLDKEIHTMSYNDFADLWGQQKSMPGLDIDDRFILLLIVACKGVNIINSSSHIRA